MPSLDALKTLEKSLTENRDADDNLVGSQGAEFYNQMKDDPQIESLLVNIKSLIVSAKFYVDSESPEIAQRISDELGITVPDEGGDNEQAYGVSWYYFLTRALTAAEFGYSLHEILWELSDDPMPQLIIGDFRFLPQTTISEISERRGNEIEYAQQHDLSMQKGATIPGYNLFRYIPDPSTNSPYGRSLIRSAYGGWTDKQSARTIAKIAMLRNAILTPIISHNFENSQAQMTVEKALEAWADGKLKYLLLPEDVMPGFFESEQSSLEIREMFGLYNAEMAKSSGQIFIEFGLGRAGNQALLEHLIDLFFRQVNSYAKLFCGEFTNTVLKRWLDWNLGTDSARPHTKLTFEEIEGLGKMKIDDDAPDSDEAPMSLEY